MTRPSVFVHLLPALVDPHQLAGQTVVVADILRATTTIVQAFSAGVGCVRPCVEVDEAFQVARKIGPGAVLGGERRGVKIDGFELGNSPLEYTPAAMAGRVLVMTTTNGTKALRHCHLAGRVLVGSFTNLAAVVAEIESAAELHVVCAGTGGVISREDVLFAGAVVDQLGGDDPPARAANDSARIALATWQAVSPSCLSAEFGRSLGGENLIKIGLQRDLDFAGQISSTDLVPAYEPGENSIRLT